MKSRQKIFYGWWIVVGAFLLNFVGIGIIMNTLSVFIKPVTESMGVHPGRLYALLYDCRTRHDGYGPGHGQAPGALRHPYHYDDLHHDDGHKLRPFFAMPDAHPVLYRRGVYGDRERRIAYHPCLHDDHELVYRQAGAGHGNRLCRHGRRRIHL